MTNHNTSPQVEVEEVNPILTDEKYDEICAQRLKDGLPAIGFEEVYSWMAEELGWPAIHPRFETDISEHTKRMRERYSRTNG